MHSLTCSFTSFFTSAPPTSGWLPLRFGRPVLRKCRGLSLVGLLALPACTDATREMPEALRYTKRFSVGNLPVSFEANHGQFDSPVRFLARAADYHLILTVREAVLAFSSHKDTSRQNPTPGPVVRLQLIGANASPEMRALEELPATVNYFRGNDPQKWQTNVPTYAKVQYSDVYPGVDLIYHANARRLEYDFVVAPGANPDLIRLGFEGIETVKVDKAGNLVLSITGGSVEWEKPVLYQENNGHRSLVMGEYVVFQPRQIGFRVGSYDRDQPLIIDPVLSYATYLGGSDVDAGFGVAVDAVGNAYVTGRADSPDFPTTVGTVQPNIRGGPDAFIAKLDPTGSSLVYCTYLGGTNDESGLSVAVDPSGNAYVAGYTKSLDFPTTPGTLQPTFGGGSFNTFVAKLNPAGSALVYSTYFGAGTNNANSIAADAAGNAYVTGSTEAAIPTTPAGVQRAFGGGPNDAFVAKLNPAGSALVYSTYLGGSNFEAGFGIAVDAAGDAYVTGQTGSANFPTTAGAVQPTFGGGLRNAFITKLSPDGSDFIYSTYLGGSNDDIGFGIAVDNMTDAYVTGDAESADFPTTAGAVQRTLRGPSDGFVTKLNATGSSLIYSTYLGGSAHDGGFGIAVDILGNAYVTGSTLSLDFPTTPGAIQPSAGDSGLAYVTKFNPSGSAFAYSTYLGPFGTNGRGIALDPVLKTVYVTGDALAEFPTTPGAFQTTFGGWVDAFVAKIADAGLAGTPGRPNCFGQSVSALARQHGGLANAAAALGFDSVQALQQAIRKFCGR